MRTLVEQTAAVRDWFGRLAAGTDSNGRLPRPEDVHLLMGGVEAEGWLEGPERPAVLVGTQDLLLSRALRNRAQRDNRPAGAPSHMISVALPEDISLQRDNRPAGAPSHSLWISATLDPAWLATVDHLHGSSGWMRTPPGRPARETGNRGG